jgi:hypothetical protein
MGKRKKYARGADVVIPPLNSHGWKPFRSFFIHLSTAAGMKATREVRPLAGEDAYAFFTRVQARRDSELKKGPWDWAWIREAIT